MSVRDAVRMLDLPEGPLPFGRLGRLQRPLIMTVIVAMLMMDAVTAAPVVPCCFNLPWQLVRTGVIGAGTTGPWYRALGWQVSVTPPNPVTGNAYTMTSVLVNTSATAPTGIATLRDNSTSVGDGTPVLTALASGSALLQGSFTLSFAFGTPLTLQAVRVRRSVVSPNKMSFTVNSYASGTLVSQQTYLWTAAVQRTLQVDTLLPPALNVTQVDVLFTTTGYGGVQSVRVCTPQLSACPYCELRNATQCQPSASSSATPTRPPSGSAPTTPSSSAPPTASSSASGAPSASDSPTSAPSGSTTSTASASATQTPTSSPCPTATSTTSNSLSSTASASPSPSLGTSPSITPSSSPSASATSTVSASSTPTPSTTQSGSATPSASSSAAPTSSTTATATPSTTASATPTPTSSTTNSATPTPSSTVSLSASSLPTQSLTPSGTPTPSRTPSITPAPLDWTCNTGLAGRCAQGIYEQQPDGSYACMQTYFPQPEACNGLDDDCDNSTDNGLPYLSCGVGDCARTIYSCLPNGTLAVCVPGVPGVQICNDADGDCNGLGGNDQNACGAQTFIVRNVVIAALPYCVATPAGPSRRDAGPAAAEHRHFVSPLEPASGTLQALLDCSHGICASPQARPQPAGGERSEPTRAVEGVQGGVAPCQARWTLVMLDRLGNSTTVTVQWQARYTDTGELVQAAQLQQNMSQFGAVSVAYSCGRSVALRVRPLYFGSDGLGGLPVARALPYAQPWQVAPMPTTSCDQAQAWLALRFGSAAYALRDTTQAPLQPIELVQDSCVLMQDELCGVALGYYNPNAQVVVARHFNVLQFRGDSPQFAAMLAAGQYQTDMFLPGRVYSALLLQWHCAQPYQLGWSLLNASRVQVAPC